MRNNEIQKVIGYVRVSTDEQALHGYGLEVQERAIKKEAQRRGWVLVDMVRDEGVTGATLDRPGLHEALTRAAQGEAQAVVASKLDRLSRSLVGTADLMEWAATAGIYLIAFDPDLDTSSANGRLLAQIMAVVAEWEREQISSRTLDAASVRRSKGLRMGREGVRDKAPKLAQRIQRQRDKGSTWQAIADSLNTDKVATIRGGTKWRVSSVQSAAGYVRPIARARRGVLPDLPKRRRMAANQAQRQS
jgi:DNA invertase Pin-like site-specific DNA recombinase